MSVEGLLDQAGGFGRFQVLAIIVINMGRFFSGWSMYHMTFAGIVPDFYCSSDVDSGQTPDWSNSSILKQCSTPSNASDVNSSMTDCSAYIYKPDSYATVINEWNLVCGKDWVKATLTSIQMAGLFFGCLIAGQLGDMIGRRWTCIIFVSIHCLANIGASFTTNWIEFAVCRCIIGVGIGGILVTCFVFVMEFIPTRLRSISACIPAWACGVGVFSLTAWQTQDWRTLHLICGTCGLIQLPLLLLIPESMRWLATQGRLAEAEAALGVILKWNKKEHIPGAAAAFKATAAESQQSRDSGQKYTYLDVVRPWSTAKITLIMCYHWCCYSLAYYGISFGISSLAGNVFLNIFLVGMLEVPFTVSCFYTTNIFGRKWVGFVVILLACVSATGCLVLQLVGEGGNDSMAITVLSFVAKVSISVAWTVIQLWGGELYPTVTRNIGHGAANTSARIGGILAPQIINFDSAITLSYIVITAMLVVDIVLILLTPETRGMDLQDSLHKVQTLDVADKNKANGDTIGLGQANGKENGHLDNKFSANLDVPSFDIHQSYTNQAFTPGEDKSPNIIQYSL